MGVGQPQKVAKRGPTAFNLFTRGEPSLERVQPKSMHARTGDLEGWSRGVPPRVRDGVSWEQHVMDPPPRTARPLSDMAAQARSTGQRGWGAGSEGGGTLADAWSALPQPERQRYEEEAKLRRWGTGTACTARAGGWGRDAVHMHST